MAVAYCKTDIMIISLVVCLERVKNIKDGLWNGLRQKFGIWPQMAVCLKEFMFVFMGTVCRCDGGNRVGRMDF